MLKKVVPWLGLSGLALMTACGGGSGSVNPPPATQPTASSSPSTSSSPTSQPSGQTTSSPTSPYANNSTETLGVTVTSQQNSQVWPGATSVPSPNPVSTFAATVVTQAGQTFGNVSNLESVTYAGSNPTYYDWTQSGSAWSFGLVGYTGNATGTGNGVYLCNAPYQQNLIEPIPSSSWNALTGSGSCSYTVNTETYVFNADGSYTDTTTSVNGDGTTDKYVTTVNSDGSASYLVNSQDQGSVIDTVSAPTAGSSTVTVSTQTFPAAIPSPGSTTTPAPVVTTAPNYYMAAGFTTGAAPSPLQSDQFTPKGTVTLPASCAVPSTVLGTSATITEVDEARSVVDPMQDWNPFLSSDAIQHFYLNGVGEVCTIDVNNTVMLDESLGQQWFSTTDTAYETEQTTTESYITTTTLQAAFRKAGSFRSALPAAAMSLTMANEQMAIHRAMQKRNERRAKLSSKTRR